MRRLLCALVIAAGLASFDVAAKDGDTLRIYLARHGQTDGNLKGIAQGWTDTPLNETGLKHAAMLADRLRGVKLDGIYSSTLSRSRVTAETVATAGRKVKVKNLPGLREVWLGKGENIALNDPIFKTRPPAHRKGTILIVGHAGANGYIMSDLLGVTRQEMAKFGNFVQDNDELYVVERTEGVRPRVFKFIPEGKFNEL